MDDRFTYEREIERLWCSLRDELLKRGVDEHTAQDVAQEAWLHAVRRPPEDSSRMGGWLHVVGLRLLRDVRRRERHRLQREHAVARAERVSERQGHEASLLLRCVDDLPEVYATALRMRFVEERDIAEIAALLGVSPETIRSRLKRGLARLRARIGSSPVQRSKLSVLLAWLRYPLAVSRRGGAWKRLVVGATASVFLSAWFLSSEPRKAVERPFEPPAVSAGIPGATALRFAAERLSVPELPDETSRAAAGDHVSGVRLAGFVRSPAGDPVPGASVHAASSDDLADEIVVVADERGRYEIAVGRRKLVWATARESCDSPMCYVPSVPERADLDLFLSPTRGRASVLVLDEGGTPVAGARIRLDPFADEDQTRHPRGTMEFPGTPPSGTTEADGRAALVFPARGWVDLLVEAEGFPAWLEGRRTPEPGSSLVIRLPAPSVLSGTCVYEGGLRSAQARVEVLQHGGLVRRDVQTGHDGAFRLDGLSPGEFVIRAGEDQAHGWRSARLEDVLEPGASAEITLVLGEEASIHGSVVDQGRPVSGMLVCLSPWANHTAEGSAARSTRTDENGWFGFAGCSAATTQRLCALPGGAAVGAERVVRPGQGEVLLELEADAARLAPIELVFRGGAVDLPHLVELRIEPYFSLVLERQGAPGRFQSPPLRKGSYALVAWTPEMGAWFVEKIPHDPRSTRTHEIVVPQPGTLSVALDLPPGVPRGQAEVTVLVESFDVFGLGAVGRWRARRPLVWDPSGQVYSGELGPGQHALVVRAPGMADIFEVVEIHSAEETHRLLAGLPGIEVSLVFRSPRYLVPNEFLHLDVHTPHGTRRLDLRWRNQRVIAGGFSFLAWLPAATTELFAFTEVIDGGSTLEGGRAIEVGDLGLDTQGLVIELTPVPK